MLRQAEAGLEGWVEDKGKTRLTHTPLDAISSLPTSMPLLTIDKTLVLFRDGHAQEVPGQGESEVEEAFALERDQLA